MHALGSHPDIDAAWDAVVDELVSTTAHNALPDDRAFVGDVAFATAAQALRAAIAHAGSGQVAAVPFCPPRQFTKVRARVQVEDPPFVLPALGEVVDESIVAHVAALAALPDGYTPDTVELTRRTVRSKVAAVRFPPPQRREFAVLREDAVVARFATQKEARAWALGELRASAADADALDIVALVGRVDGPLVRVERVPRVVKGAFRLTATSPKAAEPATAGWAFAW
jgi:hypothetical protein